ncbi:DUF2264 domain-containing protein [Leclercia adecarboxylata]|uniref:DUF2264 domain-containing protein n=1 Tax=Leclercia adecarboxylata TaxID=83655 RepID=A0ABU6I457_9ENTR|nr:DUF2264 domain-containing protein [Leclercia adecarboxylata]MBZ3799954.1 DUF2264 domain-containing protein [Leclercia adecarboxylata]MBZ3804173.1 DUF2264 domain-containing protein [Leclercia adecarboxylata]MDV5240946.1 DUF2264 domain-containing protein [Leclercia adecarboxylata]MDV5277510.1 DUF2264 domain-containing protein [Leclercia adecarboxylata]MDV5459904.1 DUF2264 domain-containing protein [Leclercia adecarboxylata]
MCAANKEKSNPLSSRQDLVAALNTLLAAVDTQFPAGRSRFSLGDTSAHYATDVAQMEGLSRVLWGLFPLMAAGDSTPYSDKYIAAIKQGTDPHSAGYWGEAGPYDQRLVEMAAYGLGLALLQENLTERFSERELMNLHAWLNQITDATMPDSNWNYFAIMVQLGFKRAGLPYDQQAIDRRFAMMDAYYLGDGWYSDGPGRPKDYYISMAFHFYGLIYATLSGDEARSEVLRQRSALFAEDFIYMSAPDGASVPFGRSLTYRFAMVAFWSAVAFSGLEVFTPGIVKGIILRHLRWWQQQPITDRDGILTLGFAYPNLAMCEDYNSPGSPYWALKTYLILALPESHPFWQADEQPLPTLTETRVIPHAQQILIHTDHVTLLTAGQLELNNYVNTEAKYTKFAYSSRFGFTIERGRFGLKHAACDSMLLLADGDNYFRGRRECEAVRIDENYIFSRWSPWHDVHIESWLVPFGEWHLRLHRINSARTLQTVEGGFAVIKTEPQLIGRGSYLSAANGSSAIVDLSPAVIRQPDCVVTPPNSSVMFADCAAIPVLATTVPQGESWLCCAATASVNNKNRAEPPQLDINNNQVVIRVPGSERQLSFIL